MDVVTLHRDYTVQRDPTCSLRTFSSKSSSASNCPTVPVTNISTSQPPVSNCVNTPVVEKHGLMLCEDCPENAKRTVPAKGESRNWNLCRECWRRRGGFFKAPSYVCSEEHCSNRSYRTKGMAYRLHICELCYNKLRSEHLPDIYPCPSEPPDWSQYWYNRTVFLGNLPYRWERKDIESWVWEKVFPRRDNQLPLFEIRCEKGGRQGDHGCAKKVFKGFAFLEFQFARDAKVLLEARPLTMNSRFVVVRPCVIRGSWMWLHGDGEWVQCHNYERIDEVIENGIVSSRTGCTSISEPVNGNK